MEVFGQDATRPAMQTPPPAAEYDVFVKLAANEHNCGPPESVTKAMHSGSKDFFPMKAKTTTAVGA